MSGAGDDFVIDWEREARTGVAEALFCAGKTAGQVDAIAAAAIAAGRRMLLTRLDAAKYDDLAAATRAALDFEPLSGTAILGGPAAERRAGVGIVCAGTSDLPVAREASRSLEFAGFQAPILADIGVAGLWRLMRRIDEIRGFDVVIAVAGMEGALFSVLGGLTEAPLIAVPTSVGYGVAEGGRAALTSALASCAPGIVVVNIDNGFGAAAAAIRLIRRIGAGGRSTAGTPA
jgi:NCAIR mutase (PurE)-related protein